MIICLGMVEPIDKKRRIESTENVGRVTKKSQCKIFNPFRVIGTVSNEIPFAVGSLGSSYYVVTSVGRSFQIYDVATLHLLFVSQGLTPSKITYLTAHFHYVYAAFKNSVGIYKRGLLQDTIECPTELTINRVIVFGEYLIATSSSNEVFVYKKPTGSKLPTEYYTTIKCVNDYFDGNIVDVLHPPTYLNKIVLASTKTLFVINIRTGKVLFKSPENTFDKNIACIELAPVLDLIGVGNVSGSIQIYNIKKGKLIGPEISTVNSESPCKVSSLSFRTDGSPHVVAGLHNGDLFFYDLEKKSRVHVLRNVHKEANGGVSKVQFLNGQPIVITNGGDNSLKEYVFDPSLSSSNAAIISPPRHLRSRGGHSAPPTSIMFPQEKKSHFILSASRDRSLWSFSLRKDAQSHELSQRPPKNVEGKRQGGPSIRERFPEVVSMASSTFREGEWDNMVTCHTGETFARTWDTKNKRVGHHNLATIDGGLAKTACVSQCGNFAIIGSSKGGIAVYNLQSGLLRKKYVLHKKAVTGVCIDGMNRHMVSCGLDGIVGFYNFSNLKYLGKIQLDASVTSMIYHKSSDLVACALHDLSIVVIDVVTQKVIRILYGHSNRVTGMDFSPDGRWIVSVALDSTLRTWDLPTGGCIDGINLPNVATEVKFSPMGDFLATTHVSGNGILLWTNKSQFLPVSTKHVEETEFSSIILPNISVVPDASILDGALESDNHKDSSDGDDEVHSLQHKSLEQLDDSLITLSLTPRDKFRTLLYLDIIKKRNKPKEAPKKPENAPFFLSLSGPTVGDRASTAENDSISLENNRELQGEVADRDSTQESEHRNGLPRINVNGNYSFESEFTRLLHRNGKNQKFDEFLNFIVNAPPSVIDLELRSLNTLPPYNELCLFVDSLTQGINSNKNFDLIQAFFSLFLKVHGDIIYNANDHTLNTAIDRWTKANRERNKRLDELIKYCSGVIDFINAV